MTIPDYYLRLAQRVYQFDKKAGILLLFSVPYLENIDFQFDYDVDCSFTWDRTPQGDTYWSRIHYKEHYDEERGR